jgi:hypothetical protein
MAGSLVSGPGLLFVRNGKNQSRRQTMKKIYVDVSAQLLLTVNDDVNYDDLAGDLEEQMTSALEAVHIKAGAGEIQIIEPVMMSIDDSK